MAKNNEIFRWVAKIAIGLVVIALGTAVAWGVLKERVNNNRDRIVVIEEKADKYQTETIELRSDVKHIKEAVDRIEEKL